VSANAPYELGLSRIAKTRSNDRGRRLGLEQPLDLPADPPAECLVNRVKPLVQVRDEEKDEGNGCAQGHSSYSVFELLPHFGRLVRNPTTGKFD
jgi:hypothetical protein